MVKSEWKEPPSVGGDPKSGDVRDLCGFCEICGLESLDASLRLATADRRRTVLVRVADKLIILGVAVHDNPSKELWRIVAAIARRVELI